MECEGRKKLSNKFLGFVCCADICASFTLKFLKNEPATSNQQPATSNQFRLIGFLTLLVLLSGLTQCRKLNESQTSPIVYSKSQTKCSLLERFSHSFSLTQQTLEFRQLMKRNAQLEVTGDFDVPFWLIKDSIISGQTIQDIIIANSNGSIENWELDSTPNLSISIPFLIESWDENNYQPSTVFLPCGYNDMVDSVLLGYDFLGQQVVVNCNTSANPVYVVQFNQERLNPDGTIINFKTFLTTDSVPFISSEDRSLYRTDGDPEAIGGYKIPNLVACEARANGKPEVLYRTLSPVLPTLKSGDVQSYPRSAYSSPSFLAAYENIVASWKLQVQGSYITYVWYESDGGSSTQTVTATIPPPPGSLPGTPSISTTVTIKSDDDEMGYDTVFHEDPLNWEYSGVNIIWKMRNYAW